MIVFLTVYLGLIAGRQPVALKVDPAVHSIQLLLDGTKIQTMLGPDWRTLVDFGRGLAPHDLVAVGFNDKGEEIARVSQAINIPKPTAEVDIETTPSHVRLLPRHISYEKVRHATLTLDDKPLPLDRHHEATMPNIDRKRPHVLAAKIEFADGAVARREVVIGGEFGESMPAQLTSIAVTPSGTSESVLPPGCTLPVTAVEKPAPLVIVVRDPDTTEVNAALLHAEVRGGSIDTAVTRRAGALENGTAMRLLSAVATRIRAAGQPTAVLFPPAADIDASEGGLFWLITTRRLGSVPPGPRQWADAVAVAGVQAFASGRRRAVILIRGAALDESGQSPAGVRKYLASLGVPLFVWSVDGPRPDLEAAWGPIEDVSTIEKMKVAAAQVRATLDAQRIAWVKADPIAALACAGGAR